MIVTGDEQDSYRSLTAKILIKTFKLMPKMGIFRG